jgi:pimeloyl-ACP methyl ester carboxylesterase
VGSVTLRPVGDDSSRVRRGPRWGIRWRGGWGSVGRVLDVSTTAVTRAFQPGDGRPRPGAAVDLTVEIQRGDPMRALGLPFHDVSVPTPLGPEPAWLVGASSPTWVIFVHGKGADRTQSLTSLDLYAAQGFCSLVISYRNDRGAPASPDGRYHYGLTEWRDLEDACRWALDHGAERLFLSGDSMGGGIVVAFLERSPLASRVRGAILDAPQLDFLETVRWGIHETHLPWSGAPIPPPAGVLGVGLAAMRFGIDWPSYDLFRDLRRVRVPLLVFHGDRDDTVPFEESIRLEADRPDLVTLVRCPGAGHLECRDLDPSRYGAAVVAFLRGTP